MKKLIVLLLSTALLCSLGACGQQSAEDKIESINTETINTEKDTIEPVLQEESAEQPKLVQYLEQDYQVVYPTNKIVAASIEAIEDAVALDVVPIGSVTMNGQTPSYAQELFGSDVVNVGDKMKVNLEELVLLQPNVILGSTKFDDSETENLNKIAPTINVSHQSANWKNNLILMGELSGKKDEAENLISSYESDLAQWVSNHKQTSEVELIILRIREGELCIFSDHFYYNDMMYNELNFKVPELVQKATQQETISLEQFAKTNPQIIFVQFYDAENPDALGAMEELRSNAIWQSIPAVADGNTYYNIVDPSYQGGTYLSKKVMLDAINKTLFQ